MRFSLKYFRYFIAAIIFLIIYVALVPILYMWLIYRTHKYLKAGQSIELSSSTKGVRISLLIYFFAHTYYIAEKFRRPHLGIRRASKFHIFGYYASDFPPKSIQQLRF